MNKLLFLILLSLLVMTVGAAISGCTYHYTLHVSIGKPSEEPPGEILVSQEGGGRGVSKERPLQAPPQSSRGVEPPSPMSIDPGDISASQQGWRDGNMINIILNINSAKPSEVTTEASVQGIPGL